MGDNGTATLHHPKYFATLNNISRGHLLTSKRLLLSAPPGSADFRFQDGSGSAAETETTAKRPTVSDTFNESSHGLSERPSGMKNSEPRGEKTSGLFRNRKPEGDGKEWRETIYTESGERRHDARETTADGVRLRDSPGLRRLTASPDEGAPDGDAGDNSAKPSEGKSHSIFQLSEEHFRGIILTILGVALLDFNCDACQSPCRAYLLDVTVPEDHSAGLTMFTVMAGLGGTVGYVMGGIDWNATSFGEAFGGHIRVVFTLVIVVFVVCVASTVTSFKEMPLSELGLTDEQLQKPKKKMGKSKYRKFTNEDSTGEGEERAIENAAWVGYGALTNTNPTAYDRDGFPGKILADEDGDSYSQHSRNIHPNLTTDGGYVSSENTHVPGTGINTADDSQQQESGLHDFIPEQKTYPSHTGKQFGPERGFSLDLEPHPPIEISADVTLRTYLKSIVHMPRCLWVLCLVNLFCWMSLVCYSLYFTDFVGQAVFLGDPQSPPGSDVHNRYDDGVRLGSFGMSLYSLSCSVYSLLIEKLVRRYRAKRVYVLGQLVFTVGMAIMAAARHKVAVVLLSPTAGIMYATLFTMPYLLVAHYHTSGLFAQGDRKQVRGLGTDVAIVSSMVFLAQFLLSVAMGTIIYAVSSTTTVMVASSVLSCLGALTATQVTYLDL